MYQRRVLNLVYHTVIWKDCLNTLYSVVKRGPKFLKYAEFRSVFWSGAADFFLYYKGERRIISILRVGAPHFSILRSGATHFFVSQRGKPVSHMKQCSNIKSFIHFYQIRKVLSSFTTLSCSLISIINYFKYIIFPLPIKVQRSAL